MRVGWWARQVISDYRGVAARRSRATPPCSSGQHAVGYVRDRGRGSRLDLLELQRRDALEQPRAGAERERHDVQPQLVDQAGGEVLVDGGRAALDADVAVPGRFARVSADSIPPVAK